MIYADSRHGFPSLASFNAGMRVEMHPGTDRWMRGDRYGEVIKVTRRYVHVKMDKSGRTVRTVPGNIGAIV
jgi:hypothetical protein